MLRFNLPRLTHLQYDIPDLKKEALDSIKSKLSPHNILEEIFSPFTSLSVSPLLSGLNLTQDFARYPAVQAIELEYLHSNSKDAGIRARLPKWLEAMEDGHLPKGAAGIVASLFDKFTIAPQNQCPNNCNSNVSFYCNNCRRTFV